MSDHAVWIRALRQSHDRFSSLVSSLDDDAVQGPSYDNEWSIAQVASHLGSQAEIFGSFLDAGLSGGTAPGIEEFRPVWSRWDALTPGQQVTASVRSNEEFVSRLEGLPDADRSRFTLFAFGLDLDLSAMATLRLGEHAVHTWDVAVALDPAAVIEPAAVEMLVDAMPNMAKRVGKPVGEPRTLVIETSAPRRDFTLTTGPDSVELTPTTDPADLRLPAEALVRLVYGRLDPEHTPAELAGNPDIAALRQVFPGF